MLRLFWDNARESGNYYSILGFYWDNGKEHGKYQSILGSYWDKHKRKWKLLKLRSGLCTLNPKP